MDGLVTTAIIGLSLGVEYALLSLGFTLIFGILGVINFAHGGFYMIGGYAAYAAVHFAGMPFPAAVATAMLVTALLGYVCELLLIDRYVSDHLTPMMITLGLYLIISTALIVVFGPEPADFSFPIRGSLRSGGIYITYANLIVLLVCATVIAAVYLLMYRTDFGLALRAMADNREVATALGMRPAQYFPLAFGLATGLAGLTGALVTPTLTLSPFLGDSILGMSFLIVILGGLGSLGGAVIASFIVGIVEAYSRVYLGGSKGALALFVVVLIILVVRPNGLMGRIGRPA
ncbi:branched-chain amino acid ABC transporter permease [Chelatococcus reniformis]|jgi:branched-chain amino acid transport system permease protein|uniref:Branched-chain amino acid ABC transporter permease n=1 Tax=Chelatococcus reniformis TaxID=1494448 RepID=A0A916UDW2_9HYPH|nr:branched-chain amino acid ABC transporter permease [Chelatococcus reniformis]GGC70031.1 branched-chain amino acid ABC transporter permease [Chelatococcus reniformis]